MGSWTPVQVAIVSATGTAVARACRLLGYVINVENTLGTVVFADTSANPTASNPMPAVSANLDRQRLTEVSANLAVMLPSGASIRFTNCLHVTVPTSAEVKVYYE
jgi:hypothetical protein